MSRVPTPQSPFEPVRSYDVPELLISQVIDGEISLSSVRDTLFNPNKLSTKQRETYVTRMKERFGRNPVSDAFVDLATNPLVWLTFVLSPAGAAGIKGGARSIFGPSVKYSAWVTEHAPFLRAMLTGTQAYTGTPIYHSLMQVTEDINRLGDQVAKKVNDPLMKLRETLGVKSLDPERIVDPVKRAYVEDVEDTMWAWMNGWDTTFDTFNPVVKEVRDKKTGELINAAVALKKVTRKQLVQDNLEERLRSLGVLDLAHKYRDAMDERWVRLFGKDAAWDVGRGFEVDRDKVIMLWRGLAQNTLTKGSISIDAGTGAAAIAKLMGPEIADGVAAGVISEAKFLDMIEQVAQAPMLDRKGGRGFYFPRNQVDVVGARGLTGQDLASIRDARHYVKATGSAMPRRATQPLWHPEDLDRMLGEGVGRFLPTEAGRHLLEEQGKALVRMQAGHRGRNGVYVQRAGRTFRGLRRYFKDTGESVALYTRRIEDAPSVRVKRDDTLATLFDDSQVVGTGPKAERLKEMVEGARRRHQEFADIRAEKIKAKQWGGMSMADVLQESYGMMPGGTDAYLKAKLRNVLIPHVTGRMGLRETAAYAAVLDSKLMMQSFLNTGVGKALKESGGFTGKLYDRMRALADYDVPVTVGHEMSRGVAKWLYVTHLGVNMASVTLNLMQPLLLASTWLGGRAVMEGYVKGFKEVGGYLTERVNKHGLKTLDDVTHRELIQKHFQWADEMGIGRDAFETMDNISFPPNRLGDVGHRESVVFDYPMKLFEKAEWLNRSVTAHAVEAAYRDAGKVVTKGTDDYFRMVNDIEEGVMAAQFGSGKLNTPMVFLDGPMSNPLMRQFFSFPMRSLTGLFYQAPRIGGRGGSATAAVLHDYVRGMGISAMVYEITKGAFGADLSRGLFQSATTDLLGGERFFEDGKEFIPLPPIIDIPIEIGQGIFKGDAQMTGMALARGLVPGGVALTRVLGITPRTPGVLGDLPRMFQRSYVDWTHPTPEGMYPVFKGDGTLIDFQSGPALILKGLGVDLGRLGAGRDLDGFLVQQRDQIVEARQRVMSAYLANDVSKAENLRRAFERKFGFPLTFTQQQLQQAVRLRQRPRTERILENLPTNVRPSYTELVARSRAENLALTEDQIREAETARARDAFRPQTINLDPETLAKLKQLVAEQEQSDQITRGEGAFRAFEPPG